MSSFETAIVGAGGPRVPNLKMLRILPWFIFGMLALISGLLTVLDGGFSLTSGGPLIAGFAVLMLLRQMNGPGTLSLRFDDRKEFVSKLVPILDRLGFRVSGSTETGLDFGPKMALRARLIGEKVVLVDFVEPTLAVVSGAKGIVTQLEKRLKKAA